MAFAAAVLTVTSLAVLGSATPASASACGEYVASDFNGDGIADAAIGQPAVADGNGYVHILYGTRSGLTGDAHGTALDDQAFTVSGDHGGFGSALAAGDFNGDGCADLAVSDPDATEDGQDYAGIVYIYLGSQSGLHFQRSIQADQAIYGSAQSYGLFGSSLAAGPLGGGFDELAVGEPGEADPGSVYVFPSGVAANGLDPNNGRVFREGDGTVPGSPEAFDLFGSSLAIGDFDGDTRADLAVGDPGENEGAGAVMILRGTNNISLLSAEGSQVWSQGTAGVQGAAEPDDYFGLTLAVGDFKGNGRTDLAIGVPGEWLGDVSDAGAVNVLYSAGSSGLSATGNQVVELTGPSQDDSFGHTLAAGDFNGDGRTDLAVGADQTVDGVAAAGAVHILPGSSTGLTATGGTRWNQNTAGIDGVAEQDDYFSSSLTTLRVTSSHHDDLLIGVIGEQLGSTECEFPFSTSAHNGAVEFIPGTTGGAPLTASGSQLWDLDSAGVKHNATQICGFGSSLG